MHIKLYILLVTWFLLSRGAVGRKLVDLTHTLDSNAPKWPLTGFLKEEDMTKNTKIVWTRLEHFWFVCLLLNVESKKNYLEG